MLIKSRKELATQLNNHSVESFPGKCKPGRKLMNTIVYDKLKDKFYKIKWGEITNSEKVNFLWYNEKAEEVILNPKGHTGWFTKEEAKYLNYKEGGHDMNKLLNEVEANMVNIGNLGLRELSSLNPDGVCVVGAKAGQGKTFYGIKESAKALAEGKSVLFFATETRKDEVIDRLKRVIIETDIIEGLWSDKDSKTIEEKEAIALEFISNSELVVNNSLVMDTNYIIETMFDTSLKNGLDFVVIDSLQINLDKQMRNVNHVQSVLSKLEMAAFELKCKILVTTQLNSQD